VELGGLEPPTSWVRSKRSNRLNLTYLQDFHARSHQCGAAWICAQFAGFRWSFITSSGPRDETTASPSALAVGGDGPQRSAVQEGVALSARRMRRTVGVGGRSRRLPQCGSCGAGPEGAFRRYASSRRRNARHAWARSRSRLTSRRSFAGVTVPSRSLTSLTADLRPHVGQTDHEGIPSPKAEPHQRDVPGLSRVLRNRRSEVRILSGALPDQENRGHLQGFVPSAHDRLFVARKLVSDSGRFSGALSGAPQTELLGEEHPRARRLHRPDRPPRAATEGNSGSSGAGLIGIRGDE
jgi:hypothetical protein